MNSTIDTTRIEHWLSPLSGLPTDVDHTRFGLEEPVFELLIQSFRIDTTDKAHALLRCYDLIRRYLAPYLIKVVVDMIPDLVAAVQRDPAVKIVFLGRDGFVLGFILGVLMPEFYTRHCFAMYLPRPLVDAALQDMEKYEGKSFSAIESFRKRPNAPANPAGSRRKLTNYFTISGINIEAVGCRVHLVDVGLKGSIQEMLAAIYPNAIVSGQYVFYAASPDDPHPGSKKGYALHVNADASNEGTVMRDELPDDPELTFLYREALWVVETMISGSKNSPKCYGNNGKPDVRRHRHDQKPLRNINSAELAPEYTNPYLREGILAMNIVGIIQYARELAPAITVTGPEWHESAIATGWYTELERRSELLRDQIRGWVSRSEGTDPELARLLDGFVPRVSDGGIPGL